LRAWPRSRARPCLDHDGSRIIEASRTGPADRPRELGRAVGLELLAKGAADIIERSRPV
jgi:hydroxymethylbilane synthase